MAKKKKVEEDEGVSLDDAFSDDEDVDYAKPKPRKLEKKTERENVSESGDEVESVIIKGSKPVSQLKKGDKVKVDGLQLDVDAHYVLIDHGSTKEMAIECFDPKKDKDYQLRYFSDQVDTSMEFYELQEIVYVRKIVKRLEW